jgi:HEPN domain-containing protein
MTSFIRIFLPKAKYFMPNKIYALEWLNLSFKNLEASRILNEAEHFTDVIGVEVHQALEKILKAVLAYNNVKIPRTHDLIELVPLVKEFIALNEEIINIITVATDYYSQDRYPGPSYSIPPHKEIEAVIKNTYQFYKQVKEYVK